VGDGRVAPWLHGSETGLYRGFCHGAKAGSRGQCGTAEARHHKEAILDAKQQHAFRYHLPNVHLAATFGNDWFALKAEAFARFFGTPVFLIAQTLIVAVWIGVNMAGWTAFDVYPFILLNLAFSLQAAYAAPLILLAQTRQADRDKTTALADAEHREALNQANVERQDDTVKQTALLVELMRQNTQLTQTVHELLERVEVLTADVHKRLVPATGG
jgi:uncharacterized membrane protein